MGADIKRWHADAAKGLRVLKKNSGLGNSPDRKLRKMTARSSCTLTGAGLRKHRVGSPIWMKRNHTSIGPVLSLTG